MDTHRSISFAIMITSLARVSLEWQQRAASKLSQHPIVRHKPMPSVNAFWGVCDESVLTTCWSSIRSSCIVSYVPTLSSSMRHDPIKAFSSRFRKGKSPAFHQLSLMNESSQFQSWMGYTTSTEEWPEHFKR